VVYYFIEGGKGCMWLSIDCSYQWNKLYAVG